MRIVSEPGYCDFNGTKLEEYNFLCNSYPELSDYLLQGGINYYNIIGNYFGMYYYIDRCCPFPANSDLRCYSDSNFSIMATWFERCDVPCDFALKDLTTKEQESVSVKIQPNVTTGLFHILIDELGMHHIVVSDITGRIVLQKTIAGELDFGNDFGPGLYFLNCYNAKSKRLIFKSKLLKL